MKGLGSRKNFFHKQAYEGRYNEQEQSQELFQFSSALGYALLELMQFEDELEQRKNAMVAIADVPRPSVLRRSKRRLSP